MDEWIALMTMGNMDGGDLNGSVVVIYLYIYIYI